MPVTPPRARRRLCAAATPAAVVSLAILAALALVGCGPSEPEVEPLPAGSNILLVTVDTLRADHLSSYGYERLTSPTIDRLAAEGVRFDQPAVQWPKTGPSFASMFTATYPKDNGIVRKIGIPLPCRFRMLAEELAAAGYTTHAVVANGAVGSEFYFDQGFETYLESWKMDVPEGQDSTGAEVVTNLALGLAERLEAEARDGRPYFLWVHYLDPHTPYTPPGEWSDDFQNDEHWSPEPRIQIFDKPRQQMLGIGQEQVLDGRDELAFYVARYDAEIAYVDHQIDRLLDGLGERGLMERTLTVFTSDHGESLGEHGYFFDHGRFGFQTCLRVPLIVHYPGVLEPRVDERPVELVHLAPTLLEAAGVELTDGAWMQGRSLTPRLRGQAGDPVPADPEADEPPEALRGPRYAFSEAGYETNNKWQKIVRDERFKLVYAQTAPEQRWIGGEGVRFTLFDLLENPEETENVAEAHPEAFDRLQRALALWERAEQFPVLVDTGGACEDDRQMGSDTEELLKTLGYL